MAKYILIDGSGSFPRPIILNEQKRVKDLYRSFVASLLRMSTRKNEKTPRVLILIVLLVLSFNTLSYSAPVGDASNMYIAKTSVHRGKDLGISIGLVADIVSERKINIDDGEFEIKIFSTRLALSAFEVFNFYIDIGETIDTKYDFFLRNENYRVAFENVPIFGVGATLLVYRWNDALEVGINASYRAADLNIKKAKIGSSTYEKADMSEIKDGQFDEYQIGIETAWKTKYFTPYIGVKYSDVEVDADFTVEGVRRNASDKMSSSKYGAFIGLTLTPYLKILGIRDTFVINFEGRLIDELAFTTGIFYRF